MGTLWQERAEPRHGGPGGNHRRYVLEHFRCLQEDRGSGLGCRAVSNPCSASRDELVFSERSLKLNYRESKGRS
ncbi:hypothetical protein D187_002820 [Cystobacter fuscus DSM 2262]|uniref:Uncharacterized protein n=1 Tax=Cystobacter fuscus (strain ATCC 25194 / DSM 2262 / NBRC 100088 / M29) TaxID=1242864 RepID=S9P4C8_CYSF2|nr:hypothetical protein D187_002820 [Cystobacter fuscus DSM 2262]